MVDVDRVKHAFNAGSIACFKANTNEYHFKNTNIVFNDESLTAEITIEEEEYSFPFYFEKGIRYLGTSHDDDLIKELFFIMNSNKHKDQPKLILSELDDIGSAGQRKIISKALSQNPHNFHDPHQSYIRIRPHELVKIRKSLDITQKDMAEKLNTPLRTYQDWEHGVISGRPIVSFRS